MRVLAFNGSPRKNWNTATLLNKALDGAASKGAATEMIHLYDLGFKGCMSCFACKLIGGKSFGKCATKDELTPILQSIEAADAIILGSPIYFGRVTGEMRSFMERLWFPYLEYADPIVGCWFDPVEWFRVADRDLDARLSRKELEAVVSTRRRHLASAA